MTPFNVNLVEPACTATLPVAYATVADLLVANTNVTSITDCNLVQAITNVDVQTVTTGCNRYCTRTYTVTDACGHSSTIDQIINVNDVTAPVITGTMTPVNVNLVEPACTETLPVAYATVADLLVANTNVTSITDCNLVQAITNVDVQTVTTGCNRYYTRTYTVTDACGHGTTIDQIINVNDVTAPAITKAAGNLTVECDGAGNTSALTTWLNTQGGATAIDCNGVTWTNNFISLSDLCGATGAATVIFKATDACGNVSTTTATFTIVDTQAPPSIASQATNKTVECDGSGNTSELNEWIKSNGGAVATDVCSGVTWSNNFTNLSDLCGATGAATVIFTATDACGNASITSAIFTIVDTQAPVITIPADFTVTFNPLVCGAVVDSNVTASDNCSGMIAPVRTTGPASGSVFSIGTTTVTHTATDACGNTSSKSFNVTVSKLAVTPNLSVTPISQQYSDVVKFKVVIPNGVSNGCSNAATSATFIVTNGSSRQWGQLILTQVLMG